MKVLVAAAVSVTAGTAAGFGRASLAVPLAVATFVFLAAALVVGLRRTIAIALAIVALGCAAGASTSWRTQASDGALLGPLADRGTVVRACGTVVGHRPRSIELRTDQIVVRERRWSTNEALRIAGRGVTARPDGERICATGALRSPRRGHNEPPLMFANASETMPGGSRLRLAASSLRRRYAAAAQSALPREQAGLLLGMTDGDTALIGDRTLEAFRTTGLAHLVAVSGENVAVLLAVVLLISRLLIRRGRFLRALIAMPPLLFFALLTGLQPSVMRAVITAGIALAVTAGGRSADAMRIALAAFIVLVLASPEALFHLGFQLSFAATFGLMMWAGPLAERLAGHLPDNGLTKALTIGVGATVSAQAAVAPLLAWRFGRVPAVGGLANLVCVPLAPFVTVGGLATLSMASMFRFVRWSPALLRLPLDLILGCARWFASVPFASFDASVLLGGASTAALATFVARSKRLRAGTAALTILLAAAASGQARALAACDGPEVVALDVGQGTAVLMKAQGKSVLVDGGPDPGGVIGDLAKQGVTHLDAAFVSHPHLDHTQGIAQALRRIDVDRVLAPVTIPWGWGAQVVREAADADVPLENVAAGDTFRFGDAISVDVLWPQPGPAPPESAELIHPWSLVLRAKISGVTVILPGDLGARQEAQLVDDGIEAPILIAPHHGSRDIDPGFVGAVSPRITLVTVGVDNPYGHPTIEALREYARYGRVYRTDRQGTVVVCLAHGAAEVTTEK